METPKSAKTDVSHHAAGTPKASKKLYWPKFSKESSPKMCSYPEKQEEFGWDDSPEPLKFDPMIITGQSKKRLECLQSPVSSHPRRHTRPPPAKRRSPVKDNDLERIEEISRRVLSGVWDNERNAPIAPEPPPDRAPKPETLQKQAIIETTSTEKISAASNLWKGSIICNSSKVVAASSCFGLPSRSSSGSSEPDSQMPLNASPEKVFDSVLQSFFQAEEDDDWLSQVYIAAEPIQTPNKSKVGLVKSRSDNQLESPGRSSGFRRSTSFQPTTGPCQDASTQSKSKSAQRNMLSTAPCNQKENNNHPTTEPQPLKKQKSFHIESTQTQTQCSLEEIEKKRLEAKYRREYREIERKKLEAQKRLMQRRTAAAPFKR